VDENVNGAYAVKRHPAEAPITSRYFGILAHSRIVGRSSGKGNPIVILVLTQEIL